MADPFNVDYANAVLGGAEQSLPEIYAQVNKANSAVPDIAQKLANFERFGGQAALGASTPGTAFGYNEAQAAGVNNLLQNLTPSSTSVWSGMQNPMGGLVNQAKEQTGINKQLAAGPMALAELSLKEAQLGNNMVNAPLNQNFSQPTAAQIPFSNISTMMNAGLNAINTGVTNIERTGVTGMAKWRMLQDIQNQVNKLGGNELPLGQLVPTIASSPNAIKQAQLDEEKLGLTSTSSSDPYIENQKYMQMVDNANQTKANYGRVIDAYSNAGNMFSNMSKGAVTTQAIPAIIQRFVVDPTQTVINPQTGKPTTLKDVGFVGGNDPAAIQKNLDLIKSQPSLARGVFAGIRNADGNPVFNSDQVNQMIDKDGTFNPDAARLALDQAKQQAKIDMEKANFITSNKMADIMANNNLQGAKGKVFSAQDAANKGYQYLQEQKALVSKNFKPMTMPDGKIIDPAVAYDNALNVTNDPDTAYKLIQSRFPTQVKNAK